MFKESSCATRNALRCDAVFGLFLCHKRTDVLLVHKYPVHTLFGYLPVKEDEPFILCETDEFDKFEAKSREREKFHPQSTSLPCMYALVGYLPREI